MRPSFWPSSPSSMCGDATEGTRSAKPHTIPCRVTGHCGSVLVRLIPAPMGSGIISAPVPKELLMMARINDCYTSARSCTTTLGNFTKATFFFLIFKKFIYLFIFGCIGSLLLCVGLLYLRLAGATLHCSARASHCGGFSCCRAQAPGARAPAVVACRLSSCGSRA